MNKKHQHKISTDQESNDQINCSCQILNDSSLENVSDSDCSCSECLEANLDAFNEFKDIEQKEKLKAARSLSKLPTQINRKNRNQQDLNDQMKNSSRYNRNSHSSLNRKTVKKSNLPQGQQTRTQRSNQDNIQNGEAYFTSQNINDYILITKQRTRRYINERKNIQNQNQKQKQQLKQKIKQNLEILKYTAKAIEKNQKHNLTGKKDDKQNLLPKYKWNHKPLVSEQKINIIKKRKHCKGKQPQPSPKRQPKRQHKKVDTNLQKIIPQFSLNPSQFLQQVKQKRLYKFKQCKGCPYDTCPNHHMRTSKAKLLKIQKFIKKRVEMYNEMKRKQKLDKEQKQKVKRAKLRAIDLKCKDKLAKSKKFDPSESRTSFHLSIDHFSTFSDLRVHHEQKMQQKEHNKQVRKMLKQKGGRLEHAIYEQFFQNDAQEQLNQTDLNVKSVPVEQRKQYCAKIMRQAKIQSPKKIKDGDQAFKKSKIQGQKSKLQGQKSKLNANEQRKRTKQVQMEIERKKRQLMKQYKRQKDLNEVKNAKLKNSQKKQLMIEDY